MSDNSKILLYDQLSVPVFSRHYLIFMTYDSNINYGDFILKYRDFKHIDYNELVSELTLCDWNPIYNSPDADFQLDINNINLLYEKTVKLKSKIIKPSQPSWLTDDIRSHIRLRNRAYVRWKCYKTSQLKESFKQLIITVRNLITSAKCNFYSARFNSAIPCRPTWSELRDLGIGKDKPQLKVDIDVQKLNYQFAHTQVPEATRNTYLNAESNCDNSFSFNCVRPCDVLISVLNIKSNAEGIDQSLIPHITHIFNTIFTTSVFPYNWKRSKIITIPKANDEFRLISILSFLSKIFEDRMNYFFNSNTLLSSKRSGFRKNRSCTTSILKISEDIRTHLDHSNVTLLILLDHTKVFDSVNHKILCTKLEKLFNFEYPATKLIET